MADVVGSDEGAGAAGVGAGRQGHPDGTGAVERKDEAEVGTGSGTQPAPGPGTDPGTADPGARAEHGEADPASGAENAPPAPVAESGTEAEPSAPAQDAEQDEAQDAASAAEAGTESGAEAEPSAPAQDAAADAEQTQIAGVAAVAVEETAPSAATGPSEAAETVVTAAAATSGIAGAAPAPTGPAGPGAPFAAPPPPAAPPPAAPPFGPAGSASFVPPGSGGGSASGASGSPLPLGLDRRKALLVGAGVVVVGGAVAAFAASGSSGGSQNTASGKAGSTAGAGGKGSASASAAAVPAAAIMTVPANGATGVDPSKPVTVQVKGGTISSVELSGQAQTNGTLSTDGSSWISDNVLSVDSGYQLTVTAKNSAGKATTTTVSFRTLSPSATFGVSSVVPPRGSTVGVGQPIRVTFSNYVPDEYKADLEKACVVNTSPAVTGAWYWVSNTDDGAVVDWRPETFWPVNTQVSIDFNLDGVRLGEHQFGVENYKPHDFTISDRDLRLIVDKDRFEATCYKNGQVIRTFPIDTGMTTAETFVTYTGTMAVLGKGNPVEMKGNYGPGDTYDDFVNWATQITWSGTYVHAAPWDADIGYANDDSHGCVHCRTVDAEWFYGMVISGDVVTINGSRTRPVTVDNGICTFTLDWPTLLKGSAYGPTVNGKPASA
jgi:lipoprotein-anchoring transpeptidase ErfK/SrfK